MSKRQPNQQTVDGQAQIGKLHHQKRTRPDVDSAVLQYGPSVAATLPILQRVHNERGFLDGEATGAVADALGRSDAEVYGVATFYSMLATQRRARNVIRVCDGPVCALHGSCTVYGAIENDFASLDDWCVERSSCLGLCDRAPAALVNREPCGPVTGATCKAAVAQIADGWRGERTTYTKSLPGEQRVAMQRLGLVDPTSIDSAETAGAYRCFLTALGQDADSILDAVDQSGLRGLGGAGFPTGKKWRMVAQETRFPKYLICNADESEPGTFKDRVLMEGDPHLLIEGMLLGAYAVRASQGVIYIRGEYAEATDTLNTAVQQARQRGMLGNDIRGSGFSFDIQVHIGAGAYICGEETALLESLEGRRGEPRLRPPFPATRGYLGYPTLVNNVETLCKIPAIVARGPAWYRSMGTPHSPGTKLMAITGHVNRPVVCEVPFGVSLRELIEKFGGGIRSGAKFKMALTGGAAGTIVPESLLDIPLDYNSHDAGVAIGSGAVIVMDDTVAVVQLLHWLLKFFEVESCGKCTPCRQGTRHARSIVEQILNGHFGANHCDELARLAHMLGATSLCGLGQSVAWPIESAFRHFREEFLCE
ncbi:MAG TPA: NADH-quinone oxidoreductase subunit NuoF [Pirellulales bacterium]|nr:NADH-quinone oxidoreductase subunit NuoF [Pirellulales bacterium]